MPFWNRNTHDGPTYVDKDGKVHAGADYNHPRTPVTPPEPYVDKPTETPDQAVARIKEWKRQEALKTKEEVIKWKRRTLSDREFDWWMAKVAPYIDWENYWEN